MSYTREQRLEDALDGFLSAGRLLKSEFERAPSLLGIPLVVNLAFAVELAAKRILERDTGNEIRGHNLDDLWNQLSTTQQTTVKSSVCSSGSITDAQFDDFMTKCAKTFVDWRYMYENTDSYTNYLFLYYLAEQLRSL